VVAEAIRALSEALEVAKLRWFLFGAQAVVVHGIPRLTADVDVTVALGSTPAATALAALERTGIVCRAAELRSALEGARLWPMVHAPTGTPIDVVIAGGGIDGDFLSRVTWVHIAGGDVPVLSAEDLIATKALTSRRKDREDILGVLELQGDRLDLERLRRTLDDLDASLEEPRARRRFERIHRQFLRKRR
jgi:Nucleotidyltransferase of unknown function (DUF6036)